VVVVLLTHDSRCADATRPLRPDLRPTGHPDIYIFGYGSLLHEGSRIRVSSRIHFFCKFLCLLQQECKAKASVHEIYYRLPHSTFACRRAAGLPCMELAQSQRKDRHIMHLCVKGLDRDTGCAQLCCAVAHTASL
jgi:hypothetical protein